MKNFHFLLILLSCTTIASAQTTLYSTDFENGGAAPTGWSESSDDISFDNSVTSTGYTNPNASGGYNLFLDNNFTFGTQNVTYDNSLSTVGFSTIKVIWGARRSGVGFPSGFPDLQWSTDGVVYNTVAHTPSTSSTWALDNGGVEVTLPAGAEGAANLRLRFTYDTDFGGQDYRIDDFRVQGTSTCTGPSTQSSSLTESGLTGTEAVLSWTNGNGANRIVVMHEATAVTATPADDNTYTANNTFASGQDIGTMEYVMFNGSGTTVTVSGLTTGSTYHYSMFDYNCSAGVERYLTTGVPTSSFVSCDGSEPTSESSAVTTVVGSTTIQFNWTAGNGQNRLVVMRQGSAVTADPVDASKYTANAAFGSGTDIGTNEFVVFAGTGNSVTVTGLTAGTQYFYEIFEYNCTDSPNYLTSGTPANGNETTCDGSEPTTESSGVTTSNISTTQIQFDWTVGNGSNRIVVLKQGSAVTATPSDASTYTADANFGGTGSDIGTGEIVVFNGTGNSVTVTGLTKGTQYFYRIFEYNCEGNPNYFTSGTPANGDETTCTDPTTQPSGSAAANITGTTMDINWTNGDGSNRLVVVKAGSAVTATPTDGMAYTANATFASGDDISGGAFEYVVYNGTGTTVTVSGLSGSTTYHWAIFEFNDCTSDPQYITASPETGNAGTSTIYYSHSATNLDLLANWNSQRDGLGAAPGSFTGTTDEFRIEDNNSTIGANWPAAGSIVNLIIEDGIAFTIPTAGVLTGTVNIEGTGSLTIDNGTNPTIGSLSTTSTVTYGDNSSTIVAATYGNLTINNTVTAPLNLAGATTVEGALTLTTELGLNGQALTLNGTLAGASTMAGSTTSTMTIGGTGALGTLTFTTTGVGRLLDLTINRTTSGTVTLGSQLIVGGATAGNGTLTLTDGNLVLNGNRLILLNSAISSTSGSITGSTSSDILIAGGGAFGSLPMDQTSAATRSLDRFQISRDAALGSNVNVADAGEGLVMSGSAKLDLAGNTLQIDGPITMSSSQDITGSTTSSISIGGTGALGTIYMDNTTPGTTDALQNLTMNRTGQTLVLGDDATISSTLVVTNGTVDNGGNTISASSANLTLSSGGTLALGGTTTFPTFNSETIDIASTVLYDGDVQTVAAKGYGNLTLSDETAGVSVKTLGAGGGSLSGALDITESDVTFDMSNLAFTLNSTASGTASILEIKGTLSNATNVTQQRYISGPIGWKFLASAITGATLNDINDDVSTTGFPNAANPGHSFTSVQFYDEPAATAGANADSGYENPTDISNSMNHGADKSGIWSYFSNDSISNLPKTVDFTGTIGQLGITVTDISDGNTGETVFSGFHALGNPYPCPVVWDQVFANAGTNGVANACYTMREGTGQLTTLAAGETIASGEGFFVQATADNADVAFDEGDKADSSDTYTNRSTIDDELLTLNIELEKSGYIEKAYVMLHPDATNNFDNLYDASKFDNFYGNTNLGLVSGWGQSMERLGIPDNITSDIPIKIYKGFPSSINEAFVISFTGVDELLANNKCLVFEDIDNNVSFPLTMDTSYAFTMFDTVTVPRMFIRVTSPIQNIVVNDLSCHNSNDGSISLTGSGSGPFVYTWKDQAGNIIPDTTGNLNNIGAGFYHIEVAGNNGSCPISYESFEIQEPSDIIATATTVDATCFSGMDGTASINAIGGAGTSFTYAWSNGQLGETASGLTAGNYTVTTTDNTGCEKEAAVVVNEPVPVQFSSTNSDASCFGFSDGAIDITVIGPSSSYSYEWSNGENSEDISSLNSGNYSVTVTDALGCLSQSSFTIDQPNEIIVDFDIVNDTILLNNGGIATFTNYTTGTLDYLWDFGDNETSSDDSPWHIYTNEGSYTVTLSAGLAPCVQTMQKTIVVANVSGINDITDNNKISFTQQADILTAKFNYSLSGDISVSIYNSIGQLVESGNRMVQESTISITLPKANGVYFIKLKEGENLYVKKHTVTN